MHPGSVHRESQPIQFSECLEVRALGGTYDAYMVCHTLHTVWLLCVGLLLVYRAAMWKSLDWPMMMMIGFTTHLSPARTYPRPRVNPGCHVPNGPTGCARRLGSAMGLDVVQESVAFSTESIGTCGS